MKKYSILRIVIIVLFFVWPVNSFASVNVVYVNGIQNTLEAAKKSENKIKEILLASENHSGDEKKSFSIWLVFNPIGFYDSEEGPDLEQDRMEMFLLKTAEELYGEDFQKTMVPFNESKLVDVEAATKVAGYFDDMTPGSNSLETYGFVTDENMRLTQKVIQSLVETIVNLDSAVVVAHSQGNLLANLAYAQIVSDFGDDASKMIRVVNVANTSEFSVSSLNFTHAGDAALYSGATAFPVPDVSLEVLPRKFRMTTRRTTPKCYDSDCNFVLAPPTLEDYSGDWDVLDHSFVGTYLSEDIVILGDNSQGVTFTPYAERFVDRFEDFVYAAAESLELPPPVYVDGDYFKTVVGTVGVGNRPYSIAIADGYAYVVNYGDSSVSIIRLSDRTVIDTISVGFRPIGIAIADGYAYVTNEWDDSVSVIRLSDRTVIDTISIHRCPSCVNVGGSPKGIAIANDYVYVANYEGNFVSVIRLSDRTVMDSIDVGGRPFGIAIANGYAYVTNRIDDSVSVIRLSDRTVIDTINVGDLPHSVAIANGYAYVTNGGDDSVSVIRLSDRTVIDTIDVGGRPSAIAIADGYAYVVNRGDYSFSVIRLSDRTVIDTIDVWVPSAIAIADGYAYVTNSGDSTVMVLSY